MTRYVAAVETSEGGGDYGDVVVVESLSEILPHPSGSSKLSSKTRIVPPSNNSYNRAFPAFWASGDDCDDDSGGGQDNEVMIMMFM